MNRGGNVIRQARLRSGLRQSELATRLGTSQGAVWRWEAGVVEPSWSTVHRAAAACGFALNDELEEVDPDEWRLACAARRMTAAQRLDNLEQYSVFAVAGREAMRRARLRRD